MDEIEFTPDQRVAQATVEMFKNFRLIIIFVMAISTFGTGFGVYSGVAASSKADNFVTKAQYEKERSQDLKERENLYKKLDKILDAARETQKDIAVINERERMREQHARTIKK